MYYTNPILKGDYSDPDVVRDGKFFYMISSSFTYVPGIPILRSADLVHWEIIGHAINRLPSGRYDVPVHKCGAWAPSIRLHNGLFYVYVCLPDEGLYAFTAKDPAGEWECHLVHDVCGWIDPCPLFDDDGRAWLIHGFAASRCGINNILYVHEMSPDGLRILDKGRLVYNGADHGDVTVEGPKLYKRGPWYWIFCPAGGVKPGYQLALRSKSVFGPYERKEVLHQGSTNVNGPHQGGLIDDGHGREWFIHFQDVDAYGRIPHLQPVKWVDNWPVIGNEGEPVPCGDTLLPEAPCSIATSDDFEKRIGLQWQWQCNPDSNWYDLLYPGLRLHAAPAESLFSAGQFLSQLMQCFDFDMDMSFKAHLLPGDRAGLGMMGYPYTCLSLTTEGLELRLGTVHEQGFRQNAWATETLLAKLSATDAPSQLRLSVRKGQCRYFFKTPGGLWQQLGDSSPLAAGGWTGARPGLFCYSASGKPGGYIDVERVTFTPGL